MDGLHRLAAAGIAAFISLLWIGHAAHAAVRWSRPHRIDPVSVSLNALACPTASQCTAVDTRAAITFSPTTGLVRRVPLRQGAGIDFIACPTVMECVAANGFGQLSIFNPRSSGPVRSPRVVPPDQGIVGLVCASAQECTALSGARAFSFDPAHPAHVVTLTLAAGDFLGTSEVACPSSTSCVAAYGLSGGAQQLLSFNPRSPRAVSETALPLATTGLACASPAQCTAVGATGASGASVYGGLQVPAQTTFDPRHPGTLAVHVLSPSGNAPLLGGSIACPSVRRCIAAEVAAAVVTFDPQGTGSPAMTQLRGAGLSGSVACPRADACVATLGRAGVVSFAPGARNSSAARAVDETGAGALRIACPALDQCTGIDGSEHGRLVGFDARAGRALGHASIDAIGVVGPVCPATDRCVLANGSGVAQYDPSRVAGARYTEFAGTDFYADALSCPTAHQCTALNAFTSGVVGSVLTFDPAHPGRTVHHGSTRVIPRIAAFLPLAALSCPSTTQCTALADNRAATFDPLRPGGARTLVTFGSRSDPTASAVSCPTLTQCTVLTGGARVATFDPQRSTAPRTTAIERDAQLTGLACPSATRCLAVDLLGGAVAFNPTAASTTAQRTVIDPDGWELSSISCPSAQTCVAGDTAGQIIVGRL